MAAQLLDAWEQGLGNPPLQRALGLLAATDSDASTDDLPRLSIGQRDRRLLQLRERLFGPLLDNTALCPDCGERIEWQSRVADFLALDPGHAVGSEPIGAIHTLESGEYRVHFRLPDSLDIDNAVAVADASGDLAAGQGQLLSLCVLAVEHAGVPTEGGVEQLPPAQQEALAQRLEQLDPLAEIRIQLQCAACEHQWQAQFDIAGFLCTEVNDWAQQTLRVVSRLAAEYGWSERDILGLSPLRRQLYLRMLER